MSEKHTKYDVVVVGSTNTDMVVVSEQLPKSGETVLGKNFFPAAGGMGANLAVAAARAGARVAFVGCVGRDPFGDRAKENLSEEGICLAHLHTVEDSASGVALILVNRNGDNMISVAPGANALLSSSMIDTAAETIENAAVLLMQMEVPCYAVQRAAASAARSGTVVVLNPAPAATDPLPSALLESVSVLIANEEEALTLALSAGKKKALEEAGTDLINSGVEKVIITLGERGGMVFEKGKDAWLYDGVQVDTVDTVAAGDCFCGWVAAGLAKGTPFGSCVIRAAGAAAISTTRHGAQPSLPFEEDIRL